MNRSRLSAIALVWARQIVAERGLAEPPPARAWALANTDAAEIMDSLRMHRLTGAAAAMAQHRPEAVPAALLPWLSRERRRAHFALLEQASLAARIQSALGSEGIPSIFFKGTFQARQFYGDVAARGVGDLDVLVPKPRHGDATTILKTLGAESVNATFPPGVQRRVDRIYHAGTYRVDGTCVDLHHRLDGDPGLMTDDFEGFSRRGEAVTVGGTGFLTLGVSDAVVHCASHASHDGWSYLRSLVDFAVGLSRLPDHSTAALAARARELNVHRRLDIGLALAARTRMSSVTPPTRRARIMAAVALSRLAQGRQVRLATSTGDAAASFAFQTLSAGTWSAWRDTGRRLVWLPALQENAHVAEAMGGAYPILAPLNLGRRLVARSGQ